MINIQFHGVVSCKWEKSDDPLHPRILHIETLDGPQSISLFPVRKPKNVEPSGPPIGGGSPAAGTVEPERKVA